MELEWIKKNICSKISQLSMFYFIVWNKIEIIISVVVLYVNLLLSPDLWVDVYYD